ncbi:unnamed protein product [Linum tenue]|uniref:Ubiquitin carboxyl-terminal hydrolase n=1 Tax=Linum tenue TaxID=586396 RepID=A0AAV0IEN5_9ROSI|nr:unnamed protein product [Linum tenue]
MESVVVAGQRSETLAVGKDGSSSSMMAAVEEVSVASTSSFVTAAMMQRKIEFHPARKQYSGLGACRDFPIETLNPDSSKRPARLEELTATMSRQVVKRGDGTTVDLWESEISSFDITFQRIGAGLRNIGNTCFLNSVLQCLTYTEPLAAYLQSGKHKSSCRIAGFCALCAIQKHVNRALRSTGISFVPDLVSNMRCVSRTLKVSKQEDAHEYLVNLLESMHKCCLPSGVQSESPAAYEKSLVHKIFGGHLRSRVQCQQCSYCSDKFDPFLDLSLEINKADALPVALRNFTAAELLDGGEKHYQCQQCKHKVRATKRLTIHKPPYVLSIHLKRFFAHDPGRKVGKQVCYERTLDIRSFVSDPNECNLKYSLYGVLVHHGSSTRFGHYVCFVRTSTGMWYCLDDEKVHQVGEKTVLNQKAYMLFYVRDRKKVAPRRQLDELKKDNNIKAPLVSSMPNMVVNKTINGVSKDALQMEVPTNQKNEPANAECSIQNPRPVSASSAKQPLLLEPALGECLKTPAQCVTENVSPTREPKDCIVSLAARTSVSGCVSSSSSEERNMATGKLTSVESLQKPSSALTVVVEVPSGSAGDKTSNAPCSAASVGDQDQVDHALSQSYPSCEKNQDGVPVNKTGDQAGHKVEVVDKECEVQNAPGSSPQKRDKKKHLKHHIHKLHLGTNFFRTSLRHGIKTKNRKRKCRSSDGLMLLKQQQLEEAKSLSSEMEPSTSKNFASPSCSANSQKKKKKKRAKAHSKEDHAGISSQGDVVGELSQRTGQNGAVLATAEQLQKSSISNSAANRQDANSTIGNVKRDAAKNCVADFLAQGLKHTTVSCWDEVNPSQTRKSNSAEVFSIGYVADEWDEEYDRGKRKKVRESKDDFSGPNPFQQAVFEKSRHQQQKEVRVDGKWMRKEKRRQRQTS